MTREARGRSEQRARSVGWAQRSGELQAPVGYDKWSYAYRDLQGSKLHNSVRIDGFGEPFGERAQSLTRSARGKGLVVTRSLALVAGPSDVIGLAIFLQPPAAGEAAGAASTDVPMNQIRFFKNGRDQGVAFENVPPGALARDARAARYVA